MTETTARPPMNPAPAPPDSNTAEASVPDGWTKDPQEMEMESNWGDKNSDGNVVARQYGLKEPIAIMCSTRQSGDCLYMLQSEGTFYLWNQIENDVFVIEQPTNLEAIKKAIDDQGIGALQVKRVFPKAKAG